MGGIRICDFYEITGTRRPCPVQDCTEYKRRSGRSNKTLGTMSIADVPTAYDLDEVLQRLEDKVKEINNFSSLTYEADIFVDIRREALLEAIEIVKCGVRC